jgi:hypothetical protein
VPFLSTNLLDHGTYYNNQTANADKGTRPISAQEQGREAVTSIRFAYIARLARHLRNEAQNNSGHFPPGPSPYPHSFPP